MIDNTYSEQTSVARPQDKGDYRTVLVSGSSGLVGQALLRRLEGLDQPIAKLVRSKPSPGRILWDPMGEALDPALIKARAVVHLAGENIADGRWTKSKMKAIRDSRAKGTRVLAESLSRMENPPAVLVSASAIGFYGDGGEAVLTESSCMGSGFLPEVCQEWERATDVARDAGIRVVNLRIGVVLARDGGALKKMLLPFKLGLGGRIGNGRQYMSWILLDDLVSVICEAIDNPELSGPVNATAPSPVRNSQFTKSLGKVLHRPTIAPMPGFAARAVFGRMADDLLLSSLRVYPEKLMEAGFQFKQPRLEGALREVLAGPQ
ncbi:MAG: hypothetical protein ACI8QS_000450 [Planctomycetota bacterium]|jgi:uncharacterized protein (TIGR01777 family)